MEIQCNFCSNKKSEGIGVSIHGYFDWVCLPCLIMAMQLLKDAKEVFKRPSTILKN